MKVLSTNVKKQLEKILRDKMILQTSMPSDVKNILSVDECYEPYFPIDIDYIVDGRKFKAKVNIIGKQYNYIMLSYHIIV